MKSHWRLTPQGWEVKSTVSHPREGSFYHIARIARYTALDSNFWRLLRFVQQYNERRLMALIRDAT